jgi:hypothetical protein
MPARILKAALGCILTLLPAVAIAEVLTFQLTPGSWTSTQLYYVYQDLPLHVGVGISAVDSVRVELKGVTALGYMLFGCHPECASESCNVPIVVNFLPEDGSTNCAGWSILSCDAENAPCVGAGFTPTGDAVAFDLESKITGISALCDEAVGFPVTDEHPDFGALFADGEAVLRLRDVGGGLFSVRCVGGRPALTEVVVRIYYDSAMPLESAAWGAIKARYR